MKLRNFLVIAALTIGASVSFAQDKGTEPTQGKAGMGRWGAWVAWVEQGTA